MRPFTLAALSQGLAKKQFSSLELTQHCLQRIAQFDPVLHCFITVTEEKALEQAKAADKQRATHPTSLLTGIPIAHKDIFCTQGIRTTCASKMLDRFIAPYTATMVAQLEKAGMVLVGKTNMDEFAMGSSNETSYYGPTRNPWDLERVPGGSSGGSASAVAAQLVPAATGTDTGGSIRQPAALCGITGLKPTYGRISRYGMIAFASSLDQAGPLAQTAEDVALLLNAMAGFDERDATSAPMPVPDYTQTLRDSLKGKKIGLPEQFFTHAGLDPTVEALVSEAIKQWEKLGVHFKTVSLPSLLLSPAAYYIVAPAECASNLSRYDGVRYGYRCENPRDLEDLYKRSRSEGFGDEVKRRIMMGMYVLSAGYYDAYYLKAQKIRKRLLEDFHSVFAEVDLLLSPTSPTPAFPLGARTNNPIDMYLSDIYTIAANLSGLPAMSIPCGFVKGLPVGLQLIAKPFEEGTLLNVAHKYQENTDWHYRTPPAYP